MFWKLLEQTVGAVYTRSANERILPTKVSNEGNIFATLPLVYYILKM